MDLTPIPDSAVVRVKHCRIRSSAREERGKEVVARLGEGGGGAEEEGGERNELHLEKRRSGERRDESDEVAVCERVRRDEGEKGVDVLKAFIAAL